jgi:hypothetical protein
MATPSNNKQTNLFAVEDWKKLYTAFSEADFQSYDFETIRKVMVDYLRTYYAEDFNDFIESSEFIALLDLIAFQAQSLAFRTDLNARENFLATAERKDSVLKLVKQLNYNPNRNKAASGLIKIKSITTTENVLDYSSRNLSKVTINWNDPSNSEWLSQFNLIINAALTNGQRVGKPFASKNINGIKTEQYNVAVPTTIQPVFPFNVNIADTFTPFEIVSASITDSDAVVENDPGSFGNFGIIYQNDSRGNASINTGYFMHFKQGVLNNLDQAFPDRVPNRVLSINLENINNEDVWFYDLNNGTIGDQWTKIPNIVGSNAVYNSVARGNRKLFSVNSRANDQIDLVFGDDTFGDTPIGNYRTYFRVSNGLTYRISPADMNGVGITIPYISKAGRPERLTIQAALQYTVANSSRRDLIQEIKDKAPQNFYTQGRMVNGEDYNILPYTMYSDIIKVKSVNRYSSGISRYLDIIDPTGKYSSTDLYGSDGSFYKKEIQETTNFSFTSRNDVIRTVNNVIQPIVKSKATQHFFFEKYNIQTLPSLNWIRQTDDTNTSTGFFAYSYSIGTYQPIGNSAGVTNNLRYLLINSLIKFVPPTGYYFDSSNSLILGTPRLPSDKTEIYCSIKSQIGDGSTPIYLAGRTIGSVTLSENIPTGAIAAGCYVPFTTKLSNTLINTMVTYILNNVEFALRYDWSQTPYGEPWKIVAINNVDQNGKFNLATSGTNYDASWLLLFTNDGTKYTITYRGLDYIYSSNAIRFLNINVESVYDVKTNTVVKDNIKILESNTNSANTAKIPRQVILELLENITETDGYVDSTKVKVTFPTAAHSDLPADPTIFSTVVGSNDNTYVFYQKYIDYDNLVRYQLLDSGTINYVYATRTAIENVRNNFSNGKLFYATSEQKFYKIVYNGTANTVVDVSSEYMSYIGRQGLIFQYKHNASDRRRIDPAATNLIDTFILTRSYDEAYRNYITDMTGKVQMPDPVDSVTMRTSYYELLQLKMISDEMILNSGVYKPLFGSKAAGPLQATIQVIKNPNSNISANELKSRVIDKINAYFAIENWDFGKTFYFSELSAYLHSQLGQYLNSVVLIPTYPDSVFGDLYEIRSQPNEILISAATVDNIEVVTGIYVGLTQNSLITG